MNRQMKIVISLLLMAMLLGGCAMQTVEDMYRVPRRSAESRYLQIAMDEVMEDMEYAAPVSGENQQTVQLADLDGDGVEEYLLFARGRSEKPMRILIFRQDGQSYRLMDTIESRGTSFEQVEYVNMDGEPGLELVVGRQVSDQVLRSVSVYTFARGAAEQLVVSNYSKFLTCDLDGDGNSELLILHPGQTDEENGIATLYSYRDGAMERSREASLSAGVGAVKRIMAGKLGDQVPAVYIASAVNEDAIVTDIFAMKDDLFTNISFSNESGTSVGTLRNYYIYADDLDGDGVLELPGLMTMRPVSGNGAREQQDLIRWFSLDSDGMEQNRMFTFHNFVGGWYLELREDLAERVSVEQTGNTFLFYVWNGEKPVHALSLFALTGADREEQAVAENRFVLCRAEGVVYAGKLEGASAGLGLAEDDLINSFHLIHQAWKTGET